MAAGIQMANGKLVQISKGWNIKKRNQKISGFQMPYVQIPLYVAEPIPQLVPVKNWGVQNFLIFRKNQI
jgi:hypothetical protein